MLSNNKAELIGFLCAEGNYYDSTLNSHEFYKNRGKAYLRKKRNVYIQFGNFNPQLLQRFHFLLKEEYNYSPKIEKDRIRISKRTIIRDLLDYSNYGCMAWQVPEEIRNDKVSSIPFIRGYFEGDGHASNKVVFSSSNLKGCLQVIELLNKLLIETTLQGPYFRENKEPEYHIYVRRKSWKRFFSVIKPQQKAL